MPKSLTRCIDTEANLIIKEYLNDIDRVKELFDPREKINVAFLNNSSQPVNQESFWVPIEHFIVQKAFDPPPRL